MEFVYTVPREKLFPDCYPQGFVPFGAGAERRELLERIAEHGFFVEREHAERSPALKQIIPYALVCAGEELLLTRRSKRGGEARLFGKHSLGIGGHVEPCDLAQRASAEGARARGPGLIEAATRRELDEELLLEGTIAIEPLGIVNDDSNAVGAVHLGWVQCVRVDGNVHIRERELLSGGLVPPSELRRLLDEGADFETWSALIASRIDEVLPNHILTVAAQGRTRRDLHR